MRTLILDGNRLGDSAATPLARSGGLERLDWLSLHQTGIGKKGIELLASSHALEGRFTGLPGYASIGRVHPNEHWYRPTWETAWEEG